MTNNRLIKNIILKLHAESSCKRATFLIEKRENVRIKFREWMEMQAHLAICPLCTLYKVQSQMLQKIMIKVFQKRKDITLSMDRNKKEALEKIIYDKSDDANQ